VAALLFAQLILETSPNTELKAVVVLFLQNTIMFTQQITQYLEQYTNFATLIQTEWSKCLDEGFNVETLGENHHYSGTGLD
jgi:hypothetical protein